eukprot:CAMPEP_0172528584 /NCGR_PEP_ID=MMETSP1067-20121228/2941_1 /TAXON_ID=265564 ORGANISM="Thalassiosira punctigera, Strain Tpunct2005C2" /NCGR_SAMPLE_ID=MMETSP1067 /ASSEMBLY_ACC=CAM_ASM_000444 /LENGTH=48 /DNA_ID= /DNA_START= /DNA_END= /DNA_ORIENTATION=
MVVGIDEGTWESFACDKSEVIRADLEPETVEEVERMPVSVAWGGEVLA